MPERATSRRIRAAVCPLLALLCGLPTLASATAARPDAALSAVDGGELDAGVASAPGFGLVTGSVKNRAGDPLPNATILVDRADALGSTDAEGRYRLNLPAGRHRLFVSPEG